ncbi:hypothetical protein Golomagni_08212, partial [Golovinomyces magnicellulatus]
MTKFLLTGGSGFIAAHILERLLQQGHTVVTTVRSEDKAQRIRDAYKSSSDRLEVVIVPDIAQENAFDEVAKIPGLEVVLHTASPFHWNFTDPQRELIDPALIGTTGILRAIHRDAPSVRRVVVTSSFAAILNKDKLGDGNTTFTEKSWNPSTIADIHNDKPTAYRVSKTLAERAAWDFVEKNKPNFDLATVNPPLVLGPVVHYLATLDAINTSNDRVVAMLRGDWKKEIPFTGPVPYWVDVRDVADAHIFAAEKPEASGQRLFTSAGRFSNRELVNAVKKNAPALATKLPADDVKGGEPNDDATTFKI